MPSTPHRLLEAAERLFAERGYAGASVRAICAEAGANLNAVSYHFGGKQALYQAVLGRVGDARLESAARLLGQPPRDVADLETRLALFAEETLVAQLAEPELITILYAEMAQGFRNCDASVVRSLSRHSEVLVRFLSSARRKKLLRRGVDVEIVAGTLLERLYNQVHYAGFIEANYGTSIRAPKYRAHWTGQTIALLLFGAARQDT